MGYTRLIGRNALAGDYTVTPGDARVMEQRLIAGDLRRLESDVRDPLHLAAYARHAGCTPEQAKGVLNAFFGGLFPWDVLPLEEACALYEDLPHVRHLRELEARAARAREETTR